MKSRKNWQLVFLAAFTILLGAAAILTAMRLYQLRSQPVAPTAPAPAPAAGPACQMSFIVPTLTPTSTPTQTITPTPIPTPTCPPGETTVVISTCSSAGPAVSRTYQIALSSGLKINHAYFLGRKLPGSWLEGTFTIDGGNACAGPFTSDGTKILTPYSSFKYIDAGSQVYHWISAGKSFVNITPYNKTAEFGPDGKLYLCLGPIPTGSPTLTPTPTATSTPTPTATPTGAPTTTPTPTLPPGVTPTPTNTPAPGASPTPTTPWYATATPTPTSPLYAAATPTPMVELPKAGFTIPTIGFISTGAILLLLGILLAL